MYSHQVQPLGATGADRYQVYTNEDVLFLGCQCQILSMYNSSTNLLSILPREDVRGVAGVALATPFFQDLFYMPSRLLAIWSSAIWSSGHPVIQTSGHLIIQPSDRLVIWPSGHPDFWPSDHQVIRPSDHLVIRPSGHLTILPSGYLVIQTSGHLIIWLSDHLVI